MLQSDDYQVVGVFTTYSAHKSLVPIQATPIEFVRVQAQGMELPLLEIPMPEDTSNNGYQNTLLEALQGWSLEFDAIAFGDLYCNGIVEFRQKVFADTGIECVFPLLIDTDLEQSRDVAEQIIQSGIRAILQSVNLRHLDKSFCGKTYDVSLLDSLSEKIDPCGEVGEFQYKAPVEKKSCSFERIYFSRGTDRDIYLERKKLGELLAKPALMTTG